MKRFVFGAMLLSLTVCFAGCGGDTASVNEGYSNSAPREPGSGPVGAGGAKETKGDDSSMTAPPPPPL